MQNEIEEQSTLDRLRADHQHADTRLKELTANLSLTPEEQIEIARLKKRKLRLKDEIRVLATRSRPGSA
ncbi:MAG: DUF465 domain-containing protein [Myxococcales bacterium]|nr:DUF465 domain-containing protein [Myxococcales bacterium]